MQEHHIIMSKKEAQKTQATQAMRDMYSACMQERISSMCGKIRSVLLASGVDPDVVDDIVTNLSAPEALQRHKIISAPQKGAP